MNLQPLRPQVLARSSAFSPWANAQAPVRLLPKRTTVVRKSKLEKQKQRQQQQPTIETDPHDIPPSSHKVDEADQDSMIGETDQPSPPSEKPEA